jgi:hypothetical protein
MLGAKISKANPELGKQLTVTSAALCGIGLARGLQTVPEYTRVMSEMSELSPEEQLTYTPNYKPHIAGRLAQAHHQLKARLEEYNDMQGLARQAA